MSKTATSRKRETLAKRLEAKPPGSIEEAEAIIRGIAAGLKVCDEEIKTLRRDGASEDARKWLQLRTTIASRYTVAHRDLLRLRREHKQLIATGDAISIFTKFLASRRRQLDAAPASLSAKVNPSDPEHAREILVEWRDRLLTQLSTAENDPLRER
jgi:hypothetical protein